MRVGEINESINQKTSILLSRNLPTALVLSGAGALGSHLIDKLLDKGIQVVVVDDLEDGGRHNLLEASENRNFHLVIESPEKLDLDLPRLDYIFIVSPKNWNLDKILNIFKQFKSRCLLISSIDLYEKDNDTPLLRQFKKAENKIARFASEFNLNARVLRLGPIYGPRMDFKTKDPLIRLIAESLTGDLQKDVSLEFSSRALYFTDAVDLIIRTILAGSTAQKLFDGVSPEPVKVSEIKQVLLDPVWYESRDFLFSPLPPWPTPNLDKTIKFLNWHPKQKLITNLKETLTYFRDNEIKVPELEDKGEEQEVKKEIGELDKEKKEELEAFKQTRDKEPNLPKFYLPLSKIYLFLVITLVTYALIWPVVVLVGGALVFRYQLDAGFKNLEKGEFQTSLGNIRQARQGVEAVKSTLGTLEPIRKTGLFKREFEMGDNLTNAGLKSVTSSENTVLGVQALLQSLKAITGEVNDSPAAYLTYAQTELASASRDLSKTYAILQDEDFKKNLPSVLRPATKSLSSKLTAYSNLVEKAEAITVLLPKLVAVDGSKDYLVLLQNNMELRPGGGFIGSFAKVSFSGGKLKKIEVNDIYNIDGQLSIHVEPPKEIKEDLGQNNWYLRDSNFEPDFPTNARQAEWFFAKETGDRVEGTVAIDISAMEELLKATGPLDLPDYKETITPENLFEKAQSHAELSFFPGSQAKKSFLTALTNGVFDKIFFSPQNNWPGIIGALGKSLEEKHISVYLDDPKLFSYALSQNWAQVLPRQSEQNKKQDFLSLVEANLGANKANYYLTRNYNLETVVGKEGEIKHRLRVSYTNRSPSDTFPGGKYKNRMRIYLPFGSKLNRALFGESDITKNVTGFVDYGRSGYSMLLELSPKEQKTLVLDYSVPVKLAFDNGKAGYRLDIIKQAGTLKDPLNFTITYPISFQAISSQTKIISPQEQTISTDLSTDRSFEVEFKR